MNVTTHSLWKAGPGSVLCIFVKEFVKPRLSKSFTASQLRNSSPPVMRLLRSDGITFKKKNPDSYGGKNYTPPLWKFHLWPERLEDKEC